MRLQSFKISAGAVFYMKDFTIWKGWESYQSSQNEAREVQHCNGSGSADKYTLNVQTSRLSVYIRRNPYFNHFLRGISVFGYYPYFSVFCINCRLINRNPQLTLCSWTVPRTHAWAGTIVRPLPGELRPRGPIHVTPLGSIITNTATPLRNIESAQCRMRRHRIPV